MKIYIDSDFKCHGTDDGIMTEVETTSFDGKCQEFIEGYRFVPLGKEWINSDGKVCTLDYKDGFNNIYIKIII